jgi:hypothetical protein
MRASKAEILILRNQVQIMTSLSLIMQRQKVQLKERGVHTGDEHAMLTGSISETLREVADAKTWAD